MQSLCHLPAVGSVIAALPGAKACTFLDPLLANLKYGHPSKTSILHHINVQHS
jgi:hypothetical protein